MSKRNYHNVPPERRLAALKQSVAKIKEIPDEIGQLVAAASKAVTAIPTSIVVGQPATLIPHTTAAAHNALDEAFTTLDEMRDDAQLNWANDLWARVARTAIQLSGRITDLIARPTYQRLVEDYPAMADLVSLAQLKAASAAEFTGNRVNVRMLLPGAAQAKRAIAYRNYVNSARGLVDLAWDVFHAIEIIKKAMMAVENDPNIAALLYIPGFTKAHETAAEAVGVARRSHNEKGFAELCRQARIKAQALAELHATFSVNGGPAASILFDGPVNAKLAATGVKLFDLVYMNSEEILALDGIGPKGLADIRDVIPEPEAPVEPTLEATLLASAADNGGKPDSIGARIRA